MTRIGLLLMRGRPPRHSMGVPGTPWWPRPRDWLWLRRILNSGFFEHGQHHRFGLDAIRPRIWKIKILHNIWELVYYIFVRLYNKLLKSYSRAVGPGDPPSQFWQIRKPYFNWLGQTIMTMQNTLLLTPRHPPGFLDFPMALHTWKEQRNYLVLCFGRGFQLPTSHTKIKVRVMPL